MRSFTSCIAWTSVLFASAIAQEANITLVPAATGFESDNAAFYYSSSPLLLANDGSAADGGFRVFQVSANQTKFEQTKIERSGRSKFAVPVYDIDNKDLIVNLPAPDSIMRVYDAQSMEEIEDARKKVLGDWSAMCAWRSASSGESYLFLFGKRKAMQFLVRGDDESTQILEVQTFPIPIEGETCAVFSNGQVYLSAEDQPLYSFQAVESAKAPEINTVSEDIKVQGLGAYHANSGDFLLVAHDEVIDVFDDKIQQKGSIGLTGITDLSIEGGLTVLQSSTAGYPEGAVAFAFEGEDDTGVAVGSLKDALSSLAIEVNTEYNPADKPCDDCKSPVSDKCSENGFQSGSESCECFAGFTGDDCSDTVCKNDCSGHGKCVGANTCQCEEGWEGPDCSFVAVQAKYETDANGGDGDDPAIWVHPTRPADSRIVTTTKSKDGAGFAVFDLKGKMLQHMPAEQPNNVDVIRNFTAGSRKIDLAYAACRGDNTLCLFEITSNGSLATITGGVQSTKPDYEVYGSCAYTSARTGTTYLFVNSKDAIYLQYELSSTSNGTLTTSLVREFTGGSGGQVEGCVADNENGNLFLGEEPAGIWRYDAEPQGSSTGEQFAKVGDGKLEADVEGLSLVTAKTSNKSNTSNSNTNTSDSTAGYIIVSSQGISSYLVYERQPPHAYVMTFTIVDNVDKGVDHVSNTDGIECIGNAFNDDFPAGLCVTHDDANELAEGGTAPEASFKYVSLLDVLGEERSKGLGYL